MEHRGIGVGLLGWAVWLLAPAWISARRTRRSSFQTGFITAGWRCRMRIRLQGRRVLMYTLALHAEHAKAAARAEPQPRQARRRQVGARRSALLLPAVHGGRQGEPHHATRVGRVNHAVVPQTRAGKPAASRWSQEEASAPHVGARERADDHQDPHARGRCTVQQDHQDHQPPSRSTQHSHQGEASWSYLSAMARLNASCSAAGHTSPPPAAAACFAPRPPAASLARLSNSTCHTNKSDAPS